MLSALVALAAGLLAGCGTSALSASGSGRTSSAAAGGASSRSGTATAKAATRRVVEVTTAQTTSTTTTGTTTEPPGYKHPIIQLGDMNTDEQFILGELYDIALTHEGYTVVLTRNIGNTATSQGALSQGSLMLYPEYLNTWNTQVADVSTQFTSVRAAYNSAESYARAHGWQLLAPTPFSDTSGIAVSSQYARLNKVYSLADLGRGASITLGAPLLFAETRSGLPTLEHAYGFTPAYVQSINIGDQYTALTQGTIQATYVYTTDPELAGTGYALLSDPQHVFGFGNVVPVTTNKVINEEGPAFVEAINQVDELLTQSAIRGLNYEVTIEHHDPAAVAEQFLQGNGIIPPVHYTTVTTTNPAPPVPTVTTTTDTVTAS